MESAAFNPRGSAVPRRIRAPLTFLAHANVILALSQAAATWIVQAVAGLPHDPVPPLVAFLAFYGVYSLDRAADARADLHTHAERAGFSTRNAAFLWSSALLASAGAVALAAARGRTSVMAALLPAAALLVYSFPVLPAPLARRLGVRRVKEVLVLKNVHVAGTLAATAALLASAGTSARPAAVVAAGLFLFGRWWINTLVFDLRDEDGDRTNGVRTVPVVLGRARTLRLLHAGNVLLAAAVIAASVLRLAPPGFALLAASSAYAWAYLRAMARGGDPHFLCDVVADAELMVLAAVLWLFL
jgi:4-hydroxybenzoate polyprenyltransferase